MISKEDRCVICGSEELKVINVGKTALYECSHCGINYLQEFPSEENLRDYYQKNYKITDKEITETEKRRIFRLPEQISLISEIKRHFPENKQLRLLDVGSDKGFFLDEARRWGIDCTGVEPSEAGKEYSRLIGLKIYDSIEQAEENFDIITMWHSLEHFPNPAESLVNLRKKLTAEGRIFIRVPNFGCTGSKLFGEKWIWFQPKNHYFHFTRKSLYNILKISNFKEIEIRPNYPNNTLTKKQHRLVQKLFRKTFDTTSDLRSKISRKYEDFFGVELIATAKK